MAVVVVVVGVEAEGRVIGGRGGRLGGKLMGASTSMEVRARPMKQLLALLSFERRSGRALTGALLAGSLLAVTVPILGTECFSDDDDGDGGTTASVAAPEEEEILLMFNINKRFIYKSN